MSKPFENIVNDIEQSIVAQIRTAKLVDIPYRGLFKVPESFIQDAWDNVDKQSLQSELTQRLQTEIVNRLVNHMAAEIATDIKQILSVQERREAIRAVCRENIDRICGND